MSTALAIASVTAVLKNLLDNGVIDDQVVATVGNVRVSTLAPDLIPLDSNAPSRLNLFLYQVTPNSGWRNVGLPSRNGKGDRLTNAPLSLDLHYLLTAYGARDLHAEILLGYGMQLLHETPMLSRAGIRRALGVPGLVADPAPGSLPQDLEAIATSGLAEQVEAIKITPHTMSTEEVSKLWSAFQSRYRPSAPYLASVVLIEAQRPTPTPLPVRARKLYVAPFREPVIERILAEDVGSPPVQVGPPILARHRLVLRGRQLKGDLTIVRVGGFPVPESDVRSIADTEIVAELPARLKAGVQSVQVVHKLLMGEPAVPHAGVSSNLAAFVLHPEIVAPVALPGPGLVRLTVDPPVDADQSVVMLLNERLPPTSPPVEPPPVPRSYSFVVPARPPVSPSGPISEIDVPIAGVAPGKYLVRVQVDGAESPLGVDSQGAYSSPTVTL
jgi:uncharacterized protein DUF4255